ncbi:MAG: ComEC/Rec2 family competence protein, partial [Sarcina sp.]
KYLIKVATVLIIFLAINNLQIIAKSNYSNVTFLNVGDSDCIFIKGSTENILIDLGEKRYEDDIVATLKKEGINKIDGIILTNFNEDRHGALDKVIKNFDIKKVYLSNACNNNAQKDIILNKLKEVNVEYDFISKDWTYSKGNIYIEAKSPSDREEGLELNNSVLLYAVIDNVKYLFTSDFLFNSKEYSKILGSIRGIDVLKVSNCGKSEFTNKNLIKYLDPLISIISCENIENCKKINKLLSKKGKEIYNTKINGNIKIQRILSTKKVNVTTEK